MQLATYRQIMNAYWVLIINVAVVMERVFLFFSGGPAGVGWASGGRKMTSVRV